MLGLLRTTPTFDNGNGLTGSEAAENEATFVAPDGSQRSYRAGVYDNPYWTVAKNPSFDDVNRFIGNLQFECASHHRQRRWIRHEREHVVRHTIGRGGHRVGMSRPNHVHEGFHQKNFDLH